MIAETSTKATTQQATAQPTTTTTIAPTAPTPTPAGKWQLSIYPNLNKPN